MAHLFGKSKPQTASKKMEVDREQTIQRFASEKDRLEKRKAFIEQTVYKRKNDAAYLFRSGQKDAAILELKRCKMNETQILNLTNMITALDNTEQSINGAKDLSSFMQVQQQGVQVLNDILSEVDAGKFDDIQGQIEDRQQQMQEIFGSLALSANQGVDAEELEGELQQMCAQLPQQQQYYQPQQQQQYYQPQQQMTYGIPQVPQGPINAPQQPAQQQTSDEELEKMMAGI